jgi:hypothetical protein
LVGAVQDITEQITASKLKENDRRKDELAMLAQAHAIRCPDPNASKVLARLLVNDSQALSLVGMIQRAHLSRILDGLLDVRESLRAHRVRRGCVSLRVDLAVETVQPQVGRIV